MDTGSANIGGQMNVCPIATANVPVERVWKLLSNPHLYDGWWDGETIEIDPPGPATEGQRILLRSRGAGRSWLITSRIEMVDESSHQLKFSTQLPLGLRIDTHVSCVAVNDTTCRVQYG